MAKRQAKRATQQLSDDQRAKIRKLREQIEQEKSEILARARAVKAASTADSRDVTPAPPDSAASRSPRC
jgi:hypothetical protein